MLRVDVRAAALQVPKGAERIVLATLPTVSPDGARIGFVWAGDIWTASIKGGRAQRMTTHLAEESSPAFSPNGKEIAFTSQRTGTWQVFVMSSAGGVARQVSHHTEGHSLMDWYPDGKHLLVRARRDQRGPKSERFLKISRRGRKAEQLVFDAAGDEGRVSPDGRQVLFQRGGAGLYRKGYSGSQSAQSWLWNGKEFSKVVVDRNSNRSARWGSGGGEIFYISSKDGNFNLYRRQLDGTKEHQLTSFENDSVMLPAVSRDGSVVVFRHLADFYRLGLSEKKGRPEKIVLWSQGERLGNERLRNLELRRADQVSFSKDGLEIAFVAGGDLWVMDTILREPRRVTDTPAEEREPVFSPDGASLIYIRDDGHTAQMCRARRGDSARYWWQNDSFENETLTPRKNVIEDIIYSPDGKWISMIKGNGDLWVTDADGKNGHRVVESWYAPRYDWSPDSKWLAYSVYDNDFNRDVWIVPVDNSREAFNLSRHPDSDGGVRWSPDGKLLAFTGRRHATETDIYYVWLKKSDDEASSRRRTVDKAVETIGKLRPKPKPKPAPKKSPGAAPKPGENKSKPENSLIRALRVLFGLPATEVAGSGKAKPVKVPPVAVKKPAAAVKKPAAPEKKKLGEVVIDFEGIEGRLHRISIPDATEHSLFWSPDSKKLAFSAKIKGVEGIFTVEFPDKVSKPAVLLSKKVVSPQWISRDSRLIYSVSGVPGSFAKGKMESYPFKVFLQRNQSAHQRIAFRQAWRAMRDNFYDPALNNRDWGAVKKKYEGMAARSADKYAFSRAVSLMLGELNASHVGFRRASSTLYQPPGWREQTAHLGLIFEGSHDAEGLKVSRVLSGSPADRVESRIVPGEVILEIDGGEVGVATDMTTVLNGLLERDILLKVKGGDEEGKLREVVLRPISYTAARSLLAADWIEETRRQVDELSGGKLGYLNVARMMWDDFHEFEREIYAQGVGKDGLIIDVRNNGGGFTADHLLTVLTPLLHAQTVPRGGGPGYPGDRRVYASWEKPVVVLCNQNSFSNAEIFSHAVKNLGRGKLVGVPTAGGVISTGSKSIMDVGSIRMPFRGWFLPDGQDMERNGAVPHHVVWPLPGELSAGKDRQLEKAVKVLKADVETYKKRARAKPTRASQR
ncbi:MAG: S41 family peptidase [Verrucomicrobiales bacterium]